MAAFLLSLRPFLDAPRIHTAEFPHVACVAGSVAIKGEHIGAACVLLDLNTEDRVKPSANANWIYVSNPALLRVLATGKALLFSLPMNIIRRANFKTVPWDNGGGITHEVARKDTDKGLLWRLSLAEVGRDGPFSLFRGLARILTVIEGVGMDLVSPKGTLAHALPLLRPVYFSGDEELDGRLRDGPCLDFNLIYDPKVCNGSAMVLSGGESIVPAPAAIMDGVLCLDGALACGQDTLVRHDFAFLQAGDPALVLPPGAQALRLTLAAR
jgi:uncharacterized protein